jgi:1-carboxybiuret hydrolase
MSLGSSSTATEIARGVRARRTSARTVIEACLATIRRRDPQLNAFTQVLSERALAAADRIDAAIAQGKDPGPLAGVPIAVKNLFDIEGIATLAGSKINRGRPAAAADATLIRRLEAAGAILVGALNMGEYAYDFTGENAHYGPSRNPHAPDRMAGGSSGGCGTAVAAGMVPLALGSDTNGSIRVPSALCGLFGLKPTYGGLSRAGTFPFVANLDHVGPFARSAADLAAAYDAIAGHDPLDPVSSSRTIEPVVPKFSTGISGLRIGIAGGYFRRGGHPEVFAAVDRVAVALGATQICNVPLAAEARGAAYLITMTEAAALHLNRLRERPQDFDPDVRDRLLAGAMIPAAWVAKAQKLRLAFRHQMAALFEQVDVLLAPSTPCRAPLIGQKTMMLDGREVPVRPNLGLFTQPISLVGLPAASVPVWTEGEALPIGIQIIAAPWREDHCLRIAAALEARGIAIAAIAK